MDSLIIVIVILIALVPVAKAALGTAFPTSSFALWDFFSGSGSVSVSGLEFDADTDSDTETDLSALVHPHTYNPNSAYDLKRPSILSICVGNQWLIPNHCALPLSLPRLTSKVWAIIHQPTGVVE